MEAIVSHRGDLSALTEKELTGIDGIGSSTARKIREFFETGRLAKLDELRVKYPPEFVELASVPGLGPKTLARLRAELGIRNLDELRGGARGPEAARGARARREDRSRSCSPPSSGAARPARSGAGRSRPPCRSRASWSPRSSCCRASSARSTAAACAGCARPWPTSTSWWPRTTPSPFADAFLKLPTVGEVIGSGDTKTSVLTATGLQVDLRVVTPRTFGAACQYFTGSKAHNIKLRQRALARGFMLNEYGLSDAQTGEVIAGETEEDVYRALGLACIPPPMREDRGEIEIARVRARSRREILVQDVRGDLHVHTTCPATAAARSRRCWPQRRRPRATSTWRSPTTPRTWR